MTWDLYNADNRDPEQGLTRLPDKSVDVVITDPPYGEKFHKCVRRTLTDYQEGKSNSARAARTVDLGFAHLTEEERTFAAERRRLAGLRAVPRKHQMEMFG